MLYIVAIFGVILAGVLGFFLGRRGAGNAQDLVQRLEQAGRGDLITSCTREQGISDQIGHAYNQMIGMMGGNLRRIVMQSDSVAACVNELNEIKTVLDDDAKQSMQAMDAAKVQFAQLEEVIVTIRDDVGVSTGHMDLISQATESLSAEVTTIASAAEQASHNVTTMASAAEEMTSNLTAVNESLHDVNGASANVAAAVEEMTATLDEVRSRCQMASQESQKAATHTESTQTVMGELSKSAGEIGRFIGMINTIADQTNMLALNAAIEAAGAGEAGKGFAVVANEVKELASQTAEATKLISEQVAIIQQRSDTAGDATREVSELVGGINQANQEITVAVEEQNMALQEIASALSSVTRSSDDVTRNAAELQEAANEVARAALEAANGTQSIAESASAAAEAATGANTRNRETAERIHAIHAQTEIAGTAAEISLEQITKVHALANYMEGSVNTFSILIDVVQGGVEALRASQINYQTGGGETFDVRMVKEGHLAWLRRLEQAVRGRLDIDPTEASRYRECAFGHWYYGPGQTAYGNLPVFQELGGLHERVHMSAVEVLDMVQKAQPHEAIVQAMGRFSKLRAELFVKLDQLYMVQVSHDHKMIEWDDSLDVGVKQFNEDHLKLMDYINELHDAMKNGLGGEKAGDILTKLVDFTKTHFAREEGIMKKHGYHRYEEQKAEHVKLIASLGEKQADLEAGSATVALDLLSFLQTWLIEHIKGEDMQYRPFFAQKGVN
ncbi:bacteriohemerythrin [Magnetococcus sp. PR-3]|uniref:bacteriohemerythrin n=1 Tax=Magnetococcus sp. PR-3 TaxID=3120355 RepID=UPI002FCDE3EC